MTNLNETQIELLYEISEKHLEWYSLFYENPPSYEVLIELNYRKLSYKINSESNSQNIDKVLNRMLSTYVDLIDYFHEKTID